MVAALALQIKHRLLTWFFARETCRTEDGGRRRHHIQYTKSQKSTDNPFHLSGEIGMPQHGDWVQCKEVVDEDVGDHPEVSHVRTHFGARKVGDSIGIVGADIRGENSGNGGPNDDYHDRDGEYDSVPGSYGQTVEHGGHCDLDDARGQVETELVGPIELFW